MKSREEHLRWAKQRARICVDMGRFADAVDVADPAVGGLQRPRAAFIAAAGSAFITMIAQTRLATPIA